MTKMLDGWQHLPTKIQVGDMQANVYLTADGEGGYKVGMAWDDNTGEDWTDKVRFIGNPFTPHVYNNTHEVIIRMHELVIDKLRDEQPDV